MPDPISLVIDDLGVVHAKEGGRTLCGAETMRRKMLQEVHHLEVECEECVEELSDIMKFITEELVS